ncbi:Fimbrial protein precursor [Planctomycetes bacterium Pan216]|uniref:Fimbrial protein n=1 Tax=Kolteria novifilia TaxID=2527975 RepID=A0A518B8K9_9BACT|nr:Fimbrial protein precursor [Planctomycetes bacterium Pan216]
MVRVRSAFTLVELLVVIAIIGILVALLLPAVQQAREAARRSQCQSNLRQQGIALSTYSSSHGQFPPGSIFGANLSAGNPCHGNNSNSRINWGSAPWTVLILPFLDEQALYDRLNFDLPFDYQDTFGPQGHNFDLVYGRPVAQYRCPSHPASLRHPGNTSYMGVQGGFDNATDPSGFWCRPNSADNRGYSINGVLTVNGNINEASISDGTSKVFMVGESKYQRSTHPSQGHIGWASGGRVDRNWSAPGVLATAIEQINGYPEPDQTIYQTRMFGSFHPGGCYFLLADGSTHFINESIDLNTYRQLAIRNDGSPLGGLSQ